MNDTPIKTEDEPHVIKMGDGTRFISNTIRADVCWARSEPADDMIAIFPTLYDADYFIRHVNKCHGCTGDGLKPMPLAEYIAEKVR